MKRVLLMICSLILVAACVFGLFACVTGITDVMNIMDYKLADEAMARDGIAQARDGIVQLKENEQTYVDGCVQYVDGKKQIADNTQAYLEGKELLGTIEPLMPVVDGYVELRDSTVANLPGFDLLQEGVANLVSPLTGELGLELPEGTSDLPGAVQDMVTDGKAQLAMYEDGVQQLAAAEPQLEMFKDGEAQLADGMVQLQDQMTAGELMKSGEQVTPSLKELLGVEGEDEYFDLYQHDDNGDIKTSAVGVQLLDLDAVSKVCDTAEEYLEISGEDTTNELVGRIAANGLGAVAAILGLIAGVFGIVAAITGGVKTGKTLGIISALFAIGANVAGIIVGYNDFAYGTRNVCDQATATEEELANMVVTPCGDLQFKALIILACAAVLFVVFASIAKKAAKKNQAKKQAQENAAAAAVAAKSVSYDNERLAKLEAENAELKAMVSSLAEQTVKE